MPLIPAVAAPGARPVDAEDALVDVEVERPGPRPHDVLIEVRAVSVNPVDVKQRASVGAQTVLGFDGAGVVVALGSAVTLFAVGDEVVWAGDVQRPGSDQAVQAVDERIVGRKPASLSFTDAAALPLTSITAWEGLFERLRIDRDADGVLLLIGAAGGVGSMVLQLAEALLPGVTVIATASTDPSRDWARRLGAEHVIGHHGLGRSVPPLAPEGVDWIFSTHTPADLAPFAAVLKPFGQIVAIDDPETLDVVPLKSKAIGFHWEFMFERAIVGGDAQVTQHRLLAEVADLVDAGRVATTATVRLSPIDAATLREAHRTVEGGGVVGKVVIGGGFPGFRAER